jgi:soluble lytic murein transglycosylase-like protein
LATASVARADLVFLTSGRSLSVKTHRLENGQAIFELRGGGEVMCDASLVARIAPDEVPWPEDATAAVPSPGPAASPRAALTPFDHLIEPLALRLGVEPSLVRAVVATESAFAPTARSHKGAMGLMQLMPDTARQYAVADPYDPSANLEAGIRHLKSMLDRYDMRIALAAYNAGEGAVRRHRGIPPFQETLDYVERVLRRLDDYRRAAQELPVGSGGSSRPPFASPTS